MDAAEMIFSVFFSLPAPRGPLPRYRQPDLGDFGLQDQPEISTIA
jgi:hypothetical protein